MRMLTEAEARLLKEALAEGNLRLANDLAAYWYWWRWQEPVENDPRKPQERQA